MKKCVAACTDYTDEEKAALLRELQRLEQAREMALFIGSVRESLKGFCDKWLHHADSIEHDFRFLLSGEANPDLHRFAAYRDHAGALCREIEKAAKLFEITLPCDAPAPKALPAHTATMSQLVLFE